MQRISYIIRNYLLKLVCTAEALWAPKNRNGKLAIHVMFKNEAPFLKEWIDYHLSQGVDYIYLTNDGSSDHWREILEPYRKAGKLNYEESLSDPDFYQREEGAKKSTWAQAQKDFEWLAFIDSDEFIYIPQGIKTALRALPPNASGLVLNWMMYGSAHQEDLKGGELLLEALNRRFPDLHEEHQQVKSILRSGFGARFFNKNPHYPNYSPLRPLYWLDGQRFQPKQKRILLHLGHLKHYWYRTESFYRKVKKDRRTFFDGQERNAILEDWHYRRSNAVYDPFPEEALARLKKYQAENSN